MIEYRPGMYISNKNIDRIIREDGLFVEVYQRETQKIIDDNWLYIRETDNVQEYIKEFWPEYMI